MYNKKIMGSLFAGVAFVAIISAIAFFKGEAILFAITNESQVMAEKANWDEHINSYGVDVAVDSPKE